MEAKASSSVWERTVAVSAQARANGALEPIRTRLEIVEDSGIPFVVHRLARLENKRAVTAEQRRDGFNPFLPPDPKLLVAEVADSHRAVLNRFNVIDQHLLIVTRDFEDQRQLLTIADLEALATCMVGMDGLGFYNSGTVAGASQPHKHLQLVSLPLGSGPQPTPMDSRFDEAMSSTAPDVVAALPFRHGLARLDGRPIATAAAPALFDGYRRLIDELDIDGTTPYNMLLTRRWMLVVPRREESFEGISINALGYAGSLLVKDHDQLDTVKRTGPLAVLEAVTG